MFKILVILILTLTIQTFVLKLVKEQTCFEFYPDYDDKKHEIYFLPSRDSQHNNQASIRILNSNNNILNSSDAHPHSHYLTVTTQTTTSHQICITRAKPYQTYVNFDIIDQEHFQENSKAGKQDIMKLIKSAANINVNLAKFDLTQKTIYQKNTLENLQLISQNQHHYVLFLIKIVVMIGIVLVQYWVVKRMT